MSDLGFESWPNIATTKLFTLGIEQHKRVLEEIIEVKILTGPLSI